MSKILCIIDGMTDPAFCASDYENLSQFQRVGSVDTCAGLKAESLSCILHLLGTQNIPPYLRGYAEALGEGVAVSKTDLILRASWFALDKQGCCTVPEQGPAVLPFSHADYRYQRLDSYKALLIFPHMAHTVSSIVTFPPCNCSGVPALAHRPLGNAALSSCFDQCLQTNHCLIPWGQSAAAELSPFPQKAAVICGTSIVKGIAHLLHMDLIVPHGATGDIDTGLLQKTEAALCAAEDYPFVLLHINGADEASHRKNPLQKKQFLQKIDTIVFPLLKSSSHKVIITADHGTDPITGLHLAENQPVFINM